MLSENIRAIRKSCGLSQEELAIKLNVVRQTISKWERGLSVPDSDMLISISEALDTSVGTLLGEGVSEPEADGLGAVAEKFEVVNLQLARWRELRRRLACGILLALAIATTLAFACLVVLGSPYSHWDFADPSGFSSESHRLRLSLQLSDFFYYVSESKSRAFGGILNRLPFLLSKKWEAVHIQVHLFFYHLSNMGKYA